MVGVMKVAMGVTLGGLALLSLWSLAALGKAAVRAVLRRSTGATAGGAPLS